jgi:hypothetical protein
MRCFTLKEGLEIGIQPSLRGDDMFIEAGEGPGCGHVMIEPAFAAVVKKRSESEEYRRLLYNGASVVGMPSVQDVEFTPEADMLRHSERRDGLALVNIYTPAVEHGRLIYTSRMFTETLVNGRVVRKYESFESSKGIEVLANGKGPQKEGQYLLLLSPGAGFRLERTGNLKQNIQYSKVKDVPFEPLLEVKWDGGFMDVLDEHGHQIKRKETQHRSRRRHAA